MAGWSELGANGDKTGNKKGLSDYWVLKLDASRNIVWQNEWYKYNGELLQLSLDNLPNGIYTLKITNSELQLSERIVVVH